MYIQETTAAERSIIDRAVEDIIYSVEQAQRLIAFVMDDYFGDAEQKPLNEFDAEAVKSMIWIVDNMLSDTVLKYCLTVGRTDFRGVGPHMDSMQNVYKVLACESLSDQVLKKIWASGNGTEEKLKERSEALKLPDAQAILALQKMLDREEAADDHRGRKVY